MALAFRVCSSFELPTSRTLFLRTRGLALVKAGDCDAKGRSTYEFACRWKKQLELVNYGKKKQKKVTDIKRLDVQDYKVMLNRVSDMYPKTKKVLNSLQLKSVSSLVYLPKQVMVAPKATQSAALRQLQVQSISY